MSVGLVEVVMAATANGCIGVAAGHGDSSSCKSGTSLTDRWLHRVRRRTRHYGASVTGGGVAMRLEREREGGEGWGWRGERESKVSLVS